MVFVWAHMKQSATEIQAVVFKVCSGFVDLGLVVEGTQLDTE
jgi:hypothetical protein